MFPISPSMICRCCGTHFSIFKDEFEAILQLLQFECPKCKTKISGSGIKAFFKFYPRLVQSEKELASNGVILADYSISQIMGLTSFMLLKEKIKYRCKNCNNIWAANYDPETLFYRDQPGLFKCQYCQFVPEPRSVTREFFRALNQVHDSSVKFTNMQWDLFTPIGKIPPIKQLQFRLYREKYQI